MDAYIYDAIRTPRGRGKNTGALYEVRPIDLLARLFSALQSRNHLDTSQVDDVIIGCVTPTADQGANIAKAALMYAGWDDIVPGIQINRFCASGLDAINFAAMKIRSGWEDMVVAGGVESMSRVPMESDGGALIFDTDVNVRVGYIPQGIAADLIATREGYTRETLDNYALQSQQRAANAWENNYFSDSIIWIYDRNGLVILDKDEHCRPTTDLEKLTDLSPSFEHIGAMGFDALALKKYPNIEKIHHLHTAGNSSGISDGAALILLASKAKGEAMGLRPRARIVSMGTVASESTIMLQGATPAARKALERAGLKPKDIDLWEMNEAFAAPVLKFQQDFDIDPAKINVNGGSIAMGHPLGATGAMLLGTMLNELERRDLKRGLVTLCVGGGMGVATIIERV